MSNEKCPCCGGVVVVARGYVDWFTPDEEAAKAAGVPDEEIIPLEEVTVHAHICVKCGHVRDRWLEEQEA